MFIILKEVKNIYINIAQRLKDKNIKATLIKVNNEANGEGK